MKPREYRLQCQCSRQGSGQAGDLRRPSAESAKRRTIVPPVVSPRVSGWTGPGNRSGRYIERTLASERPGMDRQRSIGTSRPVVRTKCDHAPAVCSGSHRVRGRRSLLSRGHPSPNPAMDGCDTPVANTTIGETRMDGCRRMRPVQPKRRSAKTALESQRGAAPADAAPHRRIHLGMAPAVGKSEAALHELRRLRSTGDDVVVGDAQPREKRRGAE